MSPAATKLAKMLSPSKARPSNPARPHMLLALATCLLVGVTFVLHFDQLYGKAPETTIATTNSSCTRPSRMTLPT
ncbi:hypothetical protein TrRE_jg366 [Triparma retinervis]|uniref:Uncharacterized protein n=1 Tax=Triparma retinervis TaxID=2557542 RepID=A0A9W7AJR8_9STRA|nr:hypothetical protein TrRE_jg366 [Triparma retinervis]